MSTTFLDAVNRMLRVNGIIRGDTDALTSFSNTNHNSTSQLAQIAVQNELSELMSRSLLPYTRRTTGSITWITGTRSYALPVDFIQFRGDPAFIYDATQNNHIFEYPGGEDQLERVVYDYRTVSGYPQYWYFDLGTTQKVAFFLVPDASVNGRVATFDYTGDNQVFAGSDVLPFTTVNQDFAFIDMAARRFKFLFEGKVDQPMEGDPVYREARSRLFALIKGQQPPKSYGAIYTGSDSVLWWV